MPLHARTVPPAALRAVLAALNSPPPPRSTKARGLHTDSSSLTPEVPLPVYVLTDIGRNPTAKQSGWRFLLRDGTRTVGTADAVPSADGWAFSHFGAGPYAGSAERSLHRAGMLTGPFEPRLLSVPELYMITLWLHGVGPTAQEDTLVDADLLIPLSPAPPGIAPDQPCRVDGLLPLLTLRISPTPLLRTA